MVKYYLSSVKRVKIDVDWSDIDKVYLVANNDIHLYVSS
jgi:hypothetical protein